MFQIEELVSIKETKEIVEILDKESFEFVTLYYTSDNRAYPEESLEEISDELIVRKIVHTMSSDDMDDYIKEYF